MPPDSVEIKYRHSIPITGIFPSSRPFIHSYFLSSEETDQEIDNIYSELRKEAVKNGEHA